MKLEAERWNRYIRKLIAKLQNRARQYVFKHKDEYVRTTCPLCGEADTIAFYVTYDEKPIVTWLCHRCHKESSHCRGSLYDQLRNHHVPVISWEEWKNGQRPDTHSKKPKKRR